MKHFACWRLIFALAITFAIVSGSAAQNNDKKSNDKKSAVDEVVVFAGNAQRAYTGDLRAKFAQALTNYCQEVLSLLPTNTPAKDAWVNAEGKSINSAKDVLQMMNSKQYSRSALKRTFTDCKDTVALLIQIQQLPPDKNATGSRLEASQFVKLALNFDSSLESYTSKVGLNKDAKFAIDDNVLLVIRRELLRAALQSLQDDLHQ